jgi:hypothetical protein
LDALSIRVGQIGANGAQFEQYDRHSIQREHVLYRVSKFVLAVNRG